MFRHSFSNSNPLRERENMIRIVAASILLLLSNVETYYSFSVKEATIQELQTAFHQNKLTSAQLTEFYLAEIDRLNPNLKGVIETNPEAVALAKKADEEREAKKPASLPPLHGIPVLLKDNIATIDKLNTTCGSYALLGSVVPRDAHVVRKLREAGAIILGKASISEWSLFRSFTAPAGWSARGGQGKNPYVLSGKLCGSSTGSAISVAANMVAVSLGTETYGSILCPSSYGSVVGLKPTAGLTSRGGVIAISPRQDTVGPICRTVSDAVVVLDTIVRFDSRDAEATRRGSSYIPDGGYMQFLKPEGLKGKRLGIVRDPLFRFEDKVVSQIFEQHLSVFRNEGAVVVDNLELANFSQIVDIEQSGAETAMFAEFKISLNAYLEELVASPVRSLADVIKFNEKFSNLEMTKEYGQGIMLAAEKTNGMGKDEEKAVKKLARLSENGFVKLMKENKLDALVSGDTIVARVLAIGGFPGISVPAAYDGRGVPVGMIFGGLKGSEPTLIEIAYGFEQATKIRKPPTFLP